MVRSLLLSVTIMFGKSLPAMGLVDSNSLPARFLYANQLVEPEPPNPHPVGFMQHPPHLLKLLPNNSPAASLQLPPLPIWPMKQTRHIDQMVMSLEALKHFSTSPLAIVAADGNDGGKPPGGNNWNPDPEPQPELTPALAPVQKCLQQKRQLLRMLRIKRLWAIMTGQTTLTRILSDRIRVIEADLLDLKGSDPDTMHPGLIQRWLAEHDKELIVYSEITSCRYSGRQAGTRKKNQPSRIIKVSTTATTGQMFGAATISQRIRSTGGSGHGGDDPMTPSAEQNIGEPAVTCSKCNKVLNKQELSRIANEATASAFICNKCLSGTKGIKRARETGEETEPDSSEPARKKNKGSGRKRNHSKAVAAPPTKKRKQADTQIYDDPLEKMKKNIKYKLSEEELEKAQTLIGVFNKKNITAKYTFYKMLGFVDRRSFNGFFDNTIAFFEHVPETIKNTGMLTSMLKNKKKYIRDFAEHSQGELEYLATLDVLTSLSSMNNGKGVPEHKEVKELMGWPEWKDKTGEFNKELFRSFATMNNGRGVPKHEAVKAVLDWPEWKDRDGKFNMKLFRSFSSMYNTKGIPKHEEVKEVLSWQEWKEKDGEFNMELFRSFSSMYNTKGIIKHEEVKEVLGWPEWKDKDGEFNM
ncbi:hypothetical protein, partial [Endozoicomonas sp. SESOKO4]|uniref:hypothetical protein n=1 Tax=Endozoicomonas sp. SESOKO4 TaxID=2828745 RepID=UPI002147F73D